MKYLSSLGLVLVAVLVSFVALSASASAFTLPSVLPSTAKTFTSVNVGETQLQSRGAEPIACKRATAEGTVTQPAGDEGTFHISFTECTTKLGGSTITCTGLSDTAGIILALGKIAIVVDAVKPALGAAILFTPEEVHLSCGALVLEKLKGQVLCLILEPTVSRLSHEFHCKAKAFAEPEETEYVNEKEEKVKTTPLETAINEAAFGSAALVGLGTLVFNEKVTIDD